MTRHDTQSIYAVAFAESENGATELVIELTHAVVGAGGYEYPGNIEFRVFVSDLNVASFGNRVVFRNVCGAETNEMHAALRILTQIGKRLEKIEVELGEAHSFAEFARRALAVAGVAQIHVAPDLAGRPHGDATCTVSQVGRGGEALATIGRLEAMALALYGKRAEVAV